jgi:hypothetical protein
VSDIKISQMEPWIGAVTGNVEFPAVFANENYRIALSQLTTSTFGFGSMALQNSNAVNITGGNVAVTALSGAITVANGGTGLGATPTNGQLLIGDGSGYTLATLTAGLGIDITNTSGGISISVDGGGVGSVTSVDVSGGSTGLTTTGGPVTTAGTITLGGTLAIANGGTGATTAVAALTALGAYPDTNPSGFTSNTGTVTGVTGTAPIVSSGGAAPAISISAATTSAAGSMSAADKTKLDGIATNANNYVLPTATASTLGGAKLFDATVQTVAANAVTTTAARTYGVQLNASDQMVVNVPWTSSGSGTVTSVGGTGTVSGLTLSGTVTTSGNLTLGGTLSVTASNFASQTANTILAAPTGVSGVPTFRAIVAADIPTLNQNTTGTASNVTGTVAIANGGTGAITAPLALTALGATTVGGNVFTLTNPSAITFPRFNADNTVSALDAATFRTAIGAGTSSTTGTVTSVGGTGTVNGITLTGTVTTSGSLTLGGTLSGVSLTTQVTGTLPIANGGTNATATPTAGTVAYGTGTAYAFTSAGTTGQVLLSNGSSAPSWGGINGGTF